MNTPARLGIFGLGMVVVFGAAMGTGRLTGPVGAESKPNATHGGMEPGGAGHGGHESMLPGGLLVSDRAPSAGTYRLYLDFQHRGTVHTAEFTAEAKEG